ncbi:family 2 encapsulin nanocompartment cargo protein polyprenyl transferase [Actinomadura sp. NBRC 104425]|uniref:family 2 encapsulin nanocompartment cargo protein polyprenyl transferase n=1 Tax=Actinomadura sp. NBRC 104425 TaxID=3032204 RepID=UPI0025561548|nr:family 2 encapsulin nanocompartment cargo protein polyprenyl transferase [Actinomadura sp. NBRC 104425]
MPAARPPAAGQQGGAPRPAAEVLAWSRVLIDPGLRAVVDGLPDEVRAVTAYHFGWLDEHGRPVTGDAGKALRPALALLSAEAVGGAAADGLPAALAVELTHNFSLLHDDVMDRDRTRRHRPTAWSVFGANPAILAGDALLACAFESLAGAPPAEDASARRAPAEGVLAAGVRTLSRTVLDLVEGQCADVSFETRTDVEVPECLRMAEHKTGALLAASCALGAAYGGGTPSQVGGLRRFGAYIGLAFQLVDDLLGIWGDPAVTGKPVHADLRRRKKSLPVVAALASDTPAGGELARLYLRDGPLPEDAAARAARLVEEAGGRAWARHRARRLKADALAELDAAAPAERPRAELRALADLVLDRDH